MRRSLSLLTLSAVALLSQARPVAAQTPSPLGEWQYSAGIPLIPRFTNEIPKWSTTVGMAVEEAPTYQGSRGFQMMGGPVIDVRYRDIAFFSTGEGLGWNVLHGKNYRAGVAITYDLGRDHDSDSALNGLRDVSPTAEGKFFAEYVIFPVVARVDIRHAIFGGHGGTIGDVSLYMPIAGSQKYFVFVGPSVTFADSDYMRHYFGVDASEAAHSAYAAYTPGGGLKSAGIGVSAARMFGKHWMVNGQFAWTQLLGDAASSPITPQNTELLFDVDVDYRF